MSGQLYRRLTQVLSHTSHRRLQAGGLSPLLDESEICSAKRTVRCRRCPTALNKKVQVETFSPWLSPKESQVTIFFRRNITFFSAFVLYMNFEFNFFIFLRRHNLYHALTYDSPYYHE